MSSSLEFTFHTAPHAQPVRVEPETPLRIVLMADFSGRGTRGDQPDEPAAYALRRIDLDTMDQVLSWFAPRVGLRAGEAEVGPETPIAGLGDFHPDSLFARLQPFRLLDGLRDRLRSPSTFERAAAELAALGGAATPAEAPAPGKPAPAATAESDSATLERLLGQPRPSPAEGGAAAPARGAVDAFLQELVGPYVVPDPHPRRDECLRQVEEAMSHLMRRVLRAPDFRALETAWGGVELLLRRVEDQESVRFELVDISKARLLAEAASNTGPLEGLARALVERPAGKPPVGLLVGAYEFGLAPEDIAALQAMASVAARAGAPFLAGAELAVAGCASAADCRAAGASAEAPAKSPDAWNALRAAPEARFLCLAFPRFLLRLPYGARSDPIDAFAFEELPSAADHDAWLWGNGAFLCALVLAEAYAGAGWGFSPAGLAEVGGLPVHTVGTGDDLRVVPCGEAWLTDGAVQNLAGRGLTAIQSVQGRDAVRVHLRSLSGAAAALGGRWSA
jgi:type VI secretion system protein ImpC